LIDQQAGIEEYFTYNYTLPNNAIELNGYSSLIVLQGNSTTTGTMLGFTHNAQQYSINIAPQLQNIYTRSLQTQGMQIT
jgi:hypothetical protein